MIYVVYWIHHPEHNDVTTQGYVGYTNNFNKRMSQHSKAKRCNRLASAIKSYGWDSLNKVILKKFETEQEALDYENELRPEEMIGWNIAIGGGLSYQRGKPHTESSKQAIRDSYINIGDRNAQENARRRCILPALCNTLRETGCSIKETSDILNISTSSVKRYRKLPK